MKKKLLLTLLALLSAEFSVQIHAYDAYVNGFYFNLNKSAKTAQVTYGSISYNDYSGQVTIPSSIIYGGIAYSVTSIGNSAFNICSNLTSVTIPISVTSIGWAAFNRCTGLTAITIPESVTSIDGAPFSNCTNLSSITVASGNTVYDSRNNCNAIIETNTNKLVVACATSSIPNSVESIGRYAFSSLSLNSVNIPNSVKTIEQDAFLQCEITSLSIGSGVTSIEEKAFEYSVCSSIVVASGNSVYDSRNNCNAIIETSTNTLIKGSNNATIPNNVTSIEESAFYGCSRLTSVTIPNSVTSIGKSAFYGTGWYNNQADGLLYLCNWLLDYKGSKPSGAIELSEGTKGIAAYALDGCSGLTSVNIPNSVLYINNYAFHNCSGLISVNIPNSVTSIGCAFWGCSSLASVNIPNSVTSIDGYTFYNCSGLSSVTIPNSLTSIGSYAFYGCSGLSSITIPNSVTSIGSYAFNNCNNLTSVTVLNETPVNIEQYTFSNRANATLHVPSGTKTAYQAKPYWKQFHEIVEIANNIVFADASVKAICVAQWDTNGDNELSEEEAATVRNLGKVFKNQTDITSFNELQLFTGLTTIDDYAFYDCSNLTSVTIPNSVTSIGSYAFNGCSGLTSVTIPISVTSSGSYAFSGCNGLTSVYISDLVAWCQIDFGDWGNPLNVCHQLYLNGEKVQELVIPDGITSICKDAFIGSDITSVTIPASVTSIGNYAFAYCESLETVTVNSTEISMNYASFSGCSEITSFICTSTEPLPYNNEAFNGWYGAINSSCILYVPQESIDAYRNAGWSATFSDIREIGASTDPSLSTVVTISSKADWDAFAARVNAGETTLNAIMTNDILDGVTTMTGTPDAPYEGIFNGNGHTLTLALNNNTDYTCAPFNEVNGATITDLRVTGTITTTSGVHHASGLVGSVVKGKTFTALRCEVAVDIQCSRNGECLAAGFVGHGTVASFILKDCLFSGSITGTGSPFRVAGLVAWGGYEGPCYPQIINCLNDGTFINCGGWSPIARVGGYGTIENCYYTTAISSSGTLSDNRGIYTEETGEELRALLGDGWIVKDNKVVPKFIITGEEPTVVTISSKADWDAFAARVNAGETKLNANMTASITEAVTTMVGTEEHPYGGTFNGEGYTLTLSLSGNTYYCAPFSHVCGATIENLKTQGTVTSSGWHASGLVGVNSDDLTIRNCWVDVNIYGSCFTGGFIGYGGEVPGNPLPVLIENCLFTGSNDATDNAAGIVGWSTTYTPTITNCLNAGSFAYNGFAPIARAAGVGTISNCYYTTLTTCSGSFNDNRGIFTEKTGQELVALLGDGWKVDENNNVIPLTIKEGTNPNTSSPVDITNRSISDSYSQEVNVYGTDYVYFPGNTTAFEGYMICGVERSAFQWSGYRYYTTFSYSLVPLEQAEQITFICSDENLEIGSTIDGKQILAKSSYFYLPYTPSSSSAGYETQVFYFFNPDGSIATCSHYFRTAPADPNDTWNALENRQEGSYCYCYAVIKETELDQDCAAPAISYINGKLMFECETPGATFKSNITCEDIADRQEDEIDLSVTYHISAYAVADGYNNSEVSTATLFWIETEPMQGEIADRVEIPAIPVLMKSQDGTITIEGLGNGTQVDFFTTDDIQLGSTTSVSSIATYSTSLTPGTVVVVKIGQKTVNFIVK